MVRDDGYGNKDRSAWDNELKYFRDKVLQPDGRLERWLDVNPAWAEVESLYELEFPGIDTPNPPAWVIERALEDWDGGQPPEPRDLSGAAFERDCAATLKTVGWTCLLVGESGDQGVDIVARLGSHVVAIQCKDWSRPIGNSAVQEVHAGMTIYDCGAGVVVSRSGFTAAAVRLAESTGVLLFDFGELDSLAVALDVA